MLFSGLDDAAQDGGRAADRVRPARRRGRPGGPVHGERGVDPGRTLTEEARRDEFRDGGPPGPLQLVAARAGVDPRGPQQDHPGQAAGRHHPRRRRRDRPARQAGRRRLQRRLHRQGRPDQRGHPPPGQGRAGPLGRRPDRRPPGRARRRQDHLCCIAVRNICRGSTSRTSPAECQDPKNRRHLPRPGPTRSSRPTSSGCGCWRGRRSSTA